MFPDPREKYLKITKTKEKYGGLTLGARRAPRVNKHRFWPLVVGILKSKEASFGLLTTLVSGAFF